jgi:P27 family predicted phage terminase small subunit
MGAPRKPAKVRIAEGNRSKTPIPNEIVTTGHPEAPASLTEVERERWREVVESLPDELLSRADVSTIERMAIAWARFREARARIGNQILVLGRDGNVVRNPLLIVQKQAEETMHLCSLSLGLSPYARTRLTAPTTAEEDDLLSALMAEPTSIRTPSIRPARKDN